MTRIVGAGSRCPSAGAALGAVALVGLLLAGCGTAPEPAPAPAPRSAADVAVCARHAGSSAIVRREADAYATMPVPPVRVALVLAAAWEFYNASGAQDPMLASVMTGVATAIGDLDAQGKAATPPGGSLLDPVKIDPAGLRAAVAAVDQWCAAP